MTPTSGCWVSTILNDLHSLGEVTITGVSREEVLQLLIEKTMNHVFVLDTDKNRRASIQKALASSAPLRYATVLGGRSPSLGELRGMIRWRGPMVLARANRK